MTRSYLSDISSQVAVLRHQHKMPVKVICNVLGVKTSYAYSTLHCNLLQPKPGTKTSRCCPHILDSTDMNYVCRTFQRSHSLYLDKLRDDIALNQGKHVSITTTWRALQQLDYTWKQLKGIAKEHNEMRHHAFMNAITDLAPHPSMLMFTNESAKDKHTQDRCHGQLQTCNAFQECILFMERDTQFCQSLHWMVL